MSDSWNVLHDDEVRLLQSALSTAFSPASLLHQSATVAQGQASDVKAKSSQLPSPPVEAAQTAGASSSAPAEEDWKTEYDGYVQSWRAQSAEVREKAEKERARWETIRKAEAEEAAKRRAEHSWENVEEDPIEHPTGIPKRVSPSPVDARDLVAGESSRSPMKAVMESSAQQSLSRAAHSRHDTADDSKLSNSQKWEDIASDATSSFPSMSFPEHSDTPSPSSRHQSSQKAAPAPVSATLAVFDASLSPGTRASALLTSVAINLLLPFVNGVMLGFGEIFARNVLIGWLGWRIPGLSVATTVGLGVPGRRERRQPSSS